MTSAPVLLKYWLPVVLWMALIFSASSDRQSGQRSSRFIGPIVRWFKPEISEVALDRVVSVVRKAAHVTEYSVLSILLWWARRGTQQGTGWNAAYARFALIVAALYAITDELHQALVPGRGPSIGDVLLDTIGAVLGLFVVWLYFRVRLRWNHSDATSNRAVSRPYEK